MGEVFERALGHALSGAPMNTATKPWESSATCPLDFSVMLRATIISFGLE